ncbi:MAG: ribosome biogenesis GTPase Der [Selenomonadaceae bacterium]|nr:ribosome biogenesis GTPase Der [Selenomonadaceae bacterium]
MSKPIVAIIGRPNVGKSTLFNQIGKRRMSIVDDMAGVTRDRIYMDATWLDREFTLIDTGGIEIKSADKILTEIRTQAKIAVDEADVIIFVVDGRTGLTADDEDVAKFLRGADKPIVLAVNKIDTPKLDAETYEFYNLGLGEPIGISASNALNLGDLLDAVIKTFPQTSEETRDEDEIRIAVIGRPNVGKSSLVNAMLGEERVIVSDIPGTTRDAIDTQFFSGGTKFTLIDTAGMRRKSKIDEPVERYSVIRSLRAIDRADVVLMLIEAPAGVTEQDKKIAGYAHDSGKGCVLVVNKWDIFPNKHDRSTNRFTDELRQRLGFLQYAPVVYVSALTGQRVERVTELVKFVAEQQSMRIQTSILNELIRDAVAVNPPPSKKGKSAKIFFATQADICPPKFILFVSEPELLHFSYLRFIENRLRESFGFEGTPLKFIVRKHNQNPQDDSPPK